jgi:hypothetical protein
MKPRADFKTLERSKKLTEAIKAGKLDVNKRNLKAVQNAWANSAYWNEAFKQAGLDHSPDPEGLSSHEGIFEAWLVKAFRGSFGTDDEILAALHSVRDKITKSLR